MSNLKTFAANLRYAARNRETAIIGGGEFNAGELAAAAEAIKLAQLVADNAQVLIEALDRELPQSAKQCAASKHLSLNLRGVLDAYREAI